MKPDDGGRGHRDAEARRARSESGSAGRIRGLEDDGRARQTEELDIQRRSDRKQVGRVVIDSGTEPKIETRDRDASRCAEQVSRGVAGLGAPGADVPMRLEPAERDSPAEIEVQRPEIPIARVVEAKMRTHGEVKKAQARADSDEPTRSRGLRRVGDERAALGDRVERGELEASLDVEVHELEPATRILLARRLQRHLPWTGLRTGRGRRS